MPQPNTPRMPRVVIATSDVQDWCLPIKAHFMQKYWPNADCIVAGFRRPPTYAFPFYSIGDMHDYPYNKWSNAIIDFLNAIPDELIVWDMDDFVPVRQVDETAISMLAGYMLAHPNISRIDLTTDRELAGNAEDIASLGWLDIITNPPNTPYTMSLQCGLWRKSELLKFLVPNENPHEVELLGTRRMIDASAVVLGTRQNPCRIAILVQNGKVALGSKSYQVPKVVMRDEDLNFVLSHLPNGYAE